MTYQQYIDGQWMDALNGNTWDVINPATAELDEFEQIEHLMRRLKIFAHSKRQ